MATVQQPVTADAGDQALIILQSLLCLLREKNILSRADIEELSRKVALRTSEATDEPLPCCRESAAAAAEHLQRVTSYIGRRYGGKHGRVAR